MKQQNQIGINKYNQPVGSPIAKPEVPDKYIPWQYGRTQKYQGRQVKVSKINIRNPGTISNLATAIGTIGAGSTQFITDTLTPLAPHANEANFAIPYVAIYEGTNAQPARQLFPILGGSQSWGSYSFQNFMDWNTFATASPGSVVSAVTTTIHNSMGAAGTYLYVSQWKYFNFNSGSVT